MIIYSAKKLLRRLKGNLEAIRIYKGTKLVKKESQPVLHMSVPDEVPSSGGEFTINVYAEGQSRKPIIYNITIT